MTKLVYRNEENCKLAVTHFAFVTRVEVDTTHGIAALEVTGCDAPREYDRYELTGPGVFIIQGWKSFTIERSSENGMERVEDELQIVLTEMPEILEVSYCPVAVEIQLLHDSDGYLCLTFPQAELLSYFSRDTKQDFEEHFSYFKLSYGVKGKSKKLYKQLRRLVKEPILNTREMIRLKQLYAMFKQFEAAQYIAYHKEDYDLKADLRKLREWLRTEREPLFNELENHYFSLPCQYYEGTNEIERKNTI